MPALRLLLAVASACLAAQATVASAHESLPAARSGALLRPWHASASVGGAPQRPPRATAGSATPTAYGGCGADALPETGLQGQVPRADQESGRSRRGYRCNVRLVGGHDLRARGANFQLAWHGRCAYVGIVGDQPFQEQPRPPSHPLDGVAVLDVSDPRSPRLVRVLQSPLGRTQHEAIEVNERRGMLVVATGGLQARWIELYDVSRDCTDPVFKGRHDAGRPIYHGLRVSDDGRTIYASDNFGISGTGGMLHVIDAQDMTRPRLIATWDPTEDGLVPFGIHDLELSADGRRAYLGAQPYSSDVGILLGGPPSSGGPSLVVLDTSAVQERRQDPDMGVVSTADLPNFGHAVQRARIGGRPYLFVSGETAFANAHNCPWAWGHVLDISDERRPRPVSEIRLEVNDAGHCERTAGDGAVYSVHYVGVDDEVETTRVFYSWFTGGVRIFDVRRPERPQEVGYFHPAPLPRTTFEPSAINAGDKQTPEWDSVPSMVRYEPTHGQLWLAGIASGLQVLEPTGPAAPARGPATSRRCTIRRTVTVRFRLRRGERLRRVRASVNGPRAPARRGRRGRVTVRLGARARTRVRVVVWARTSSGRRLEIIRTVDACRSARR